MPHAPETAPHYNLIPSPRLHWGWVLLLSAFTGGIFGFIWLVVQANWVRRLTGHSRAYPWSIAALVLNLLTLPFAFYDPRLTNGYVILTWSILSSFISPAQLVAIFTAVFQLRSELIREPLGLSLTVAMTFFFQMVYFQYHLRDYPVEGVGYTRRGPGLNLSA